MDANFEDARQLLQVFHARFAARIAEEVRVVILRCAENVSPVPNKSTAEVCDSH